jgi:hypothetical protein
MPSEYNKGRATELVSLLEDEHSITEWIFLVVRVLRFLLNRYIKED